MDSAFFKANTTPGKYEAYTLSDMERGLFGNDKLSAVMVPEGYTLVVYDGDGFSGNSETYQGKVSDEGMLMC
jgi:hypothetical protein